MKRENRIRSVFTACACSKTPHSVDWNQENGWIIFGSSRNVAIVAPETLDRAPTIAGTFCEHDGDVVCVKWIRRSRGSSQTLFAVSGSTDGKAIVWRFDESQSRLLKLSTCSGHSMSVNHVCGLENGSTLLICSCSADSTIKIWEVDVSAEGGSATEIQSVGVERSGFALSADMRSWNDGIILASGHDDKKIRLFWKNDSQQMFNQVMILSGHEDWIRGISFQPAAGTDEGSLLLASCAQDSYVRIWRLASLVGSGSGGGDGSPMGPVDDNEIRLKRQTFSLAKSHGGAIACSAGLEAVLSGHEDWVYSVHWHPQGKSRLLTASMDKCLILWEPDPATGLWIEKTRLGVVGGPVASGFYGGLFGPYGTSVLGHTFQGGFHIWKANEAEWRPSTAPSGHFGPVEDVCWDVGGRYLLSCGADQTTRLYAPWIRDRKEATVHEISRPQVHGYDMQCVVSIRSSCFVSAAEEKILRAFVSTKNFGENYLRITNATKLEAERLLQVLTDPSSATADGACVPSLGLSNKAMFAGETTKTDNTPGGSMKDEEEGDVEEMDTTVAFQPAVLSAPPTEDCLMQNTLWPEVHKLYGHGCEVFAAACNHAGTIIASAAKANKPEQAQVILWSTKDWQQRGQLSGHTLTVTQIAFSPDDSHLLTVSRDRTWCLYRKGADEFDWQRIGFTDKKTAVHGRIIWSCAWSPGSEYFFTASRDKKVVVWKITDKTTGTSTGPIHQIGQVLDAPNSATAVAVCPTKLSEESYLVAVGLESGEIVLYEWNAVKLAFDKLVELNRNMAHALTVKRLRFRPRSGTDWLRPARDDGDGGDVVYLASGSEDHSVKVFAIDLRQLRT